MAALAYTSPGPGVAKPDGWQKMKHGRLRAMVLNRYPDQKVFRIRLGIFDNHGKVTIFGKTPVSDNSNSGLCGPRNRQVFYQ
jgi:hypothetical protein